MKFTPAVLAAFIGLVAAQDLSVIPACAKQCIDDAVTSGTKCALTEIPCICNSIEAVTAGATACVLAACGADVAIGQVLPATAQLCAEVLPNGPSSAGAATTITTITPLTLSSTTGGSAPTSAGEAETTPAATTPAASGAATGTSTSTTSTSTAGAASFGAVGSLGMLLMGVAAAL
ncbi:hypothetical protein B0T16DRAFT_388049 [Cercophora newfieldiana]|uniref:CFEM domain-containing protein n=1 Tax=Cercophora newfieldiana TaxID=92897 RepID=A0AA39YHR3_9PEZI|nr:hypothetical protein B0T16DRAFT_388049 [Cercophora newfieldiana]